MIPGKDVRDSISVIAHTDRPGPAYLDDGANAMVHSMPYLHPDLATFLEEMMESQLHHTGQEPKALFAALVPYLSPECYYVRCCYLLARF
jgi:hypothetical protein